MRGAPLKLNSLYTCQRLRSGMIASLFGLIDLREAFTVFLQEKNTAVDSEKSLFSNIFKLYGLSNSIATYRDPKLKSKFWKGLSEPAAANSCHPKTDRAYNVMNRMLGNSVHCYYTYYRNDRDEILPAAKFAYSSATSEVISTSSFE